jgi:hypothetical protein
VSRDKCGYLIDVDVLRRTATDATVTFQTPEQLKARDEGFADAERRFVGIRQSVECAYALVRFGPGGSEMPDLIARRPSTPP